MESDGFVEAQKDLGVCNLHLVTGEDVIGRVYLKIDADTGALVYVVTKPVLPNVGMQQDRETGQPSFRVGLLPLRPYLGNIAEVEIFKVYTIYVTPVNLQMEKLYLEFTSGIQLASSIPGGPSKLQL